ncbi:alpha/beta fold hydrolase [Rhodococcus rhodnii]|nr:alpha/beta fold hydrolase [Rhodococcus rhodnii]
MGRVWVTDRSGNSRWGVSAPGRAVVLLGVLAAVIAGCSAGPSARPDVAVERAPAPAAPTEDAPGEEPAGPPEPQAPLTDLAWVPCAPERIAALGVGDVPGITIDCAAFDAPIDASGERPGTFTAGAMRARTPETPADAPPLVLTSGSDTPSGTQLGQLLRSGLGDLAREHPIVAVDRRGIGSSTPIDCLPPDTRNGLRTLAAGETDRVGTLSELAVAATISCTDYLQPHELAFGADSAATDLDALRSAWGVDTLALLGTGNGATVALSYAAQFPDRVSRLVLDSPEPVLADAATATDLRLQGLEAALDAFARQCTAQACALGPDPRAAIDGVVRAAATGTLGDLTAPPVVAALSAALAQPDPRARVDSLAEPFSAAVRGDTAPLRALAADAGPSDGQWVARCSDTTQWPSPDRVRSLVDEWGEQYPVFGETAALRMLACSAWPSSTAPSLPDALGVPVLALSGLADPAVGSAASAATGAISSTGAPVSTLTWHGSGHPATSSECARRAIGTYLADGTLPPNGGACPA